MLILCVLACNSNAFYNHYNHTTISGWERNDTISFSVPRIKQSGKYALDMGLRTTGGYPFKSISLVVEQKQYPSKRVYIDTVTCVMLDDKGTQQANGISYYQYKINIKKIYLQKDDSISFVVRHAMKREILPGISDVGIMLSRTN